MKKLLMVLVIAVFGVVLTGNAMAIPAYGDLAVDFRTWAGANNQTTWTVGNVTAASTPSSTTLYQDNVDGLGVQPGEQGDEIDGAENLNVTFSGGMWLTGVWITDLFKNPDGGGIYGEYGRVVLYNGAETLATFYFFGKDSDQVNGEQYINFGGAKTVDAIAFYTASYEGVDPKNNEFSVAGFTAVPEPTTILLLGLGLVGLAGFRRRIQK